METKNTQKMSGATWRSSELFGQSFPSHFLQASPMDPEFVESRDGSHGSETGLKRTFRGGLARSSPGNPADFFFFKRFAKIPKVWHWTSITSRMASKVVCSHPTHHFWPTVSVEKLLGFKKPESKPSQNTKVDLCKDICFFIPNHLALRARTFKSYKGIHWLSGAMIVDDQDSNLRTLKIKEKNSRGMLT